MKILLVRPDPPAQSIGLKSFMICEPLELEYLAASAEKLKHQVEIVDMMLEKKPFRYFLQKYQPDLVGFTAYITQVGIVRKLAAEVKKWNPSLRTIVGGVHAEVNPRDFEFPQLDFIARANGIKSFMQLLQHFDKPVAEIKAIVPGLWNGEGDYPLDTDFNFPHPDRQKTAKYRSRYNYIYHHKCALLKTSFGCPFNCDFCYCIEITGRRFFTRPLEDVINELEQIKEENIFIVDDNFLYDKRRVLDFCARLREKKIQKKYILFGRADFILNNKNVMQELANIGLQAVFVGLESFKQEDLEKLNKGSKAEANVKAVHLLESLGIDCYSGIIAGPDWDKSDFTQLACWLNQFKRPAINLQALTPMPGTPLFQKYQDQYIISPREFGKWDMAHLVLKPQKLSEAEFYRQIIKTYYRSSASFQAHLRILGRYGLPVYLKTLYGSLYITFQYLRLIREAKKKEKKT